MEAFTEPSEEKTEGTLVSVQLIAMHLSLWHDAFSVSLPQSLNERDLTAQFKGNKNKGIYQQHHANKFNNLGEMGKSLEYIQHQILLKRRDYLNLPMPIKDIEFIV